MTTPRPAGHDVDCQVEAVLDILAPKTDVPAEYATVLGLTPGVRVPIIRFDYEGRAIMPSDEQIRAFAEQIVTAVRTAVGTVPRPDHEPGPDCPNAPYTCLVCEPKVRGGNASPLHEHDGLAPHSHEVRADHLGVPRPFPRTRGDGAR